MTQVKGPDGQIHTFPDNAPPEAIQSAMRAFYKLDAKPKRMGDAATEALAGMTLGGADYVTALAGPVADAFKGRFAEDKSWPPDGVQLPVEEKIAQSYSESFGRTREGRQNYREGNPITAGAANVVGSIAGVTPFVGPIQRGAAALLPGRPLLAATAGGAATGAVGGGVAGGLEAEPGKNLEGAATGAAVGGALGATLPGLIFGAGKVLEKAVVPFWKKLTAKFGTGPATEAQRKLVEALKNDGLTPDQIAARLDKMGPEATMADAGGESTLGLADTVAQSPGTARNLAKRAFEPRQRSQGRRLETAAREGLGAKGDFYGQADALIEQRAATAGPLYQQTVRPDVMVPDDAFGSVKGDPFLAKVFAKVKGDELQGMKDMPDNALPVVDAVKKELDDMISVAKRAGENNRVRLLTAKKNDMLAAVDDAIPDYAVARKAWEEPSKLRDAMDLGRKFAKGDPEITAKAVQDLSVDEKGMFREGVLREVRTIIETQQDGRNVAAKLIRAPKMRDALRATFPDNKSFRNFQLTALTEDKFSQTKNAVLGNSRTAMRQAGQEDLGLDPGAMVGLVTGTDYVGSGINIGRQLFKGAQDMPQAQKDALGEMLFSKDPATQKKALSDLSRLVVAGKVRPEALKAARDLVSMGGAVSAGAEAGRD